MRTVKFRAWDTLEKKMCNVIRINYVDDYIALVYKEQYHYHERGLADAILLQFTGLKDIHNKEIYEGDIVTGKDHFTEETCEYLVYWNNEDASFNCKYNSKTDKSEFGMSWDLCNYEVIGNIYENPELLLECKEDGTKY